VLVLLCTVLPADIRGVGRVLVHLSMLALLVSTVIREDNGLSRWLTFGALARVGALSYGIYLLHHIALGVVHRVLDPLGVLRLPAVEFVMGALASIAVAELSYRFYERRFLAFRKRFR
jgi:peptidoglycan/LPS O-acetylase OafA/YrhL